MKTKPYIVGAFYTPEYERELQFLRESCHKFDCPYWFQEYLSTGSWQKNTYLKPEFVLYMLNNFNEDILYLDADAIIKRPLDFFDSGIIGDMSMYIVPKAERDGKVWPRTEAYCYLSGTIYFKNNEKSRKFVEAWILKREKYPKLHGDQALIPYVLREDNLDLEITPLPIEYVKIFDKRVPCGEPVIIHNQASRRLKRKIKMDNQQRQVGNYDYQTHKETSKYSKLHEDDKIPTICKEFAPWINSRLKETRPSIIDLGCGKGFLRNHIPFETYTGLDIAKDTMEKLRKNAKANEVFIHGDVSQINTQQKYDVAICLNTLQHLPEDLIMESIKRISEIATTQIISVNCKKSKILAHDRSRINLTVQSKGWWAELISSYLDVRDKRERGDDIIFFCGTGYRNPDEGIKIPFSIRKNSDGSLWLPRNNKEKEAYMDKHFNRAPNQLKWYPRVEDEFCIANLSGLAEKKTVYIVGKGPSLDNLTADLFMDDGPVIALNESVNIVQDLVGLNNKVFLLQQDAGLNCNPSGAIILNERIKHLYPSTKERYLFNKYSFNAPGDPLSVVAAARIANIMCAEEIVLMCCDASTNGKTGYAECIGHNPKTVQGKGPERFTTHKIQIMKAVGKTQVSWLSPSRPVQDKVSDTLQK